MAATVAGVGTGAGPRANDAAGEDLEARTRPPRPGRLAGRASPAGLRPLHAVDGLPGLRGLQAGEGHRVHEDHVARGQPGTHLGEPGREDDRSGW